MHLGIETPTPNVWWTCTNAEERDLITKQKWAGKTWYYGSDGITRPIIGEDFEKLMDVACYLHSIKAKDKYIEVLSYLYFRAGTTNSIKSRFWEMFGNDIKQYLERKHPIYFIYPRDVKEMQDAFEY